MSNNFSEILKDLIEDKEDIIKYFAFYIEKMQKDKNVNKIYFSKEMCKFIIFIYFLEKYFRDPEISKIISKEIIRLYENTEEIKKDFQFARKIYNFFLKEKKIINKYQQLNFKANIKINDNRYYFSIDQIDFNTEIKYRDYIDKLFLDNIFRAWNSFSNDLFNRSDIWGYPIYRNLFKGPPKIFDLLDFYPYIRFLRCTIEYLKITEFRYKDKISKNIIFYNNIKNVSKLYIDFKIFFEIFIIGPYLIEILTRDAIQNLENKNIIENSNYNVDKLLRWFTELKPKINIELLDIKEKIKIFIEKIGEEIKNRPNFFEN